MIRYNKLFNYKLIMEQNIPHQLVIPNKNGVYLSNMLSKSDKEM